MLTIQTEKNNETRLQNNQIATSIMNNTDQTEFSKMLEKVKANS